MTIDELPGSRDERRRKLKQNIDQRSQFIRKVTVDKELKYEKTDDQSVAKADVEVLKKHKEA